MDAEDDLVRRSLAGDHQAFARLIEMHQQIAHRVAVATVGSGGDADDVVQDAFIKAYARLAQFDVDRSFRAWLLAIVANEGRNRLRARGRHAALTLRTSVRADAQSSARWADPVEAHETAASRDRLATAVAALPARDREVIALRYFAELSEAEAAEVMGCRPGTVKSRLSRALNRLRSHLESEVDR